MPDKLGNSLGAGWGTADSALYWWAQNSFRFPRGHFSWRPAITQAGDAMREELTGDLW